MPIDTNPANWNKENEPCDRRLLPQQRSLVQGVLGRSQASVSKSASPTHSHCSPPPTTLNPTPLQEETKEKEDQQCWIRIRRALSEDEHETSNEGELMQELLRLCSWLSETEVPIESSENIIPHQSESTGGSEEHEQPSLFHEFHSYLANFKAEHRRSAHKLKETCSTSQLRHALAPIMISDPLESEFDLNANF